MIILPSPARRECLISFWLTISVSSGLLIGALLSLLISPRWFGLGVILALTLALPGLIWPQVVSLPYRIWNRLARDFTHYARTLVLGICYYIIFAAVARTGSSLRLASPTSPQSLWIPRGTLASTAYPHQYDATKKGSSQRGWIGNYLSWAWQTGNLWTVFLLPFLILLSALESDQDKSLPTDIYTLF